MRALLTAFSPRGRLLLAAVLLVGLSALAPLGGLSLVSTSRLLVGSMALAGLGWVLSRKGGEGGTAHAAAPEPLRILSRAGLTQRCGLALVESEGRRYLVAYGDTFAEIREHRPLDVPRTLVSEPCPRGALDLEATVLSARKRQVRAACGDVRKRGGG